MHLLARADEARDAFARREKLAELFDEEEKENGLRALTAECRFCDKKYRFTENDFKTLLKNGETRKGETK